MSNIAANNYASKTSSELSTSPPLYDLQEVIQQYQSQPELLKLILTSKVEEDKRRAEEAKLRAKELDLYLQNNDESTTHRRRSISDILDQDNTTRRKSNKLMPILSTPRKSRPSPYVVPSTTPYSPTPIQHRSYHSSISSTSSSSSSVSSLSEMEEDTMDHQQRRHSAAAAMLAMGGSFVDAPSDNGEALKSEEISSAYPSPVADHYADENEDFNKPRRRREMQAITKIVETREFPYVDNYFWKNNGNTVQKKTGCKSIYYKCSNSNKGCSVNKTVTARPNGEYLIKYRGCHLPECGRVERIRDL